MPLDKKVLITDYAWADLDIERRILAEGGAELVVATATDAATLAAAAVNADAIMTNWAKVPETVIAAGRRLRIIARLGIGLDNIDIEAASRRHIAVTNVPDYCVIEVAEHSLALLLGLARKVAFYHQETKSGQYRLQAGPPLKRIEGQTLGIVGIGRIGLKLAEKAMPLGLRVLATSRRRPEDLPAGIEFCELDELLRRSDYVSLHAPLTPETRHLINASRLSRIKRGSYLINTSRGGLIDTAALVAALDSGQLAGAALDVQDPEPPPLDKPPYNDPRVVITPHAAFVSAESLENLRTRAARQVALYLNGERPENIVNPSAIGG